MDVDGTTAEKPQAEAQGVGRAPALLSSPNLAQARDQIRRLAHLHAFISLTEEEGDGPVVAVKDIVDVRGTVTTAGSLVPQISASSDAEVIERARESGCVVVGKTNMHEWAFGTTSVNSHHGTVHNPRDPSRIAGGSSGGSAAAVAAGMCAWAIGSDTGGSIRIPAALCGVVGLKPTFGTVSTRGVLPLSRSLDTLGPLAPDVLSAARALEMMTGRTGLVPQHPVPAGQFRLAVPAGWAVNLDRETQTVWERVATGLPEIVLPDRDRMQRVCLAIMYAEVAAFHRVRMEEHPERYSADILARLQDTLKVSGAEYIEALEDRERICVEVEEALQDVDALLVPGTACVAPLIGQADVAEPLARFSRPFNVTGQPAIAIPAPTNGLPIGIQVVGKRGEDAHLIEVAWSLERLWSEFELPMANS